MAGLTAAPRAPQPVGARFGSRTTVTAGLVILAFAATLGSRPAPLSAPTRTLSPSGT